MYSCGDNLKATNILSDDIKTKTILCSGQITGNPVKSGLYVVKGSAASPILFAGPTAVYTEPDFSVLPSKYVLVGSSSGTAITSITVILQAPSNPVVFLGNYEILPYCMVSGISIDANIILEEILGTGLILTISFSGTGIVAGTDSFQLSVSFNPLF